MKATNRVALKEWGAIERALGEGRVSLLLRKGGIYETRGDFRVEHREFWLFPTLYHQNAAELAEPFRSGVETEMQPSLAAAAAGESVPITLYAVVEQAFRVENPDALGRLEGLHPLAPAAVERRFRYRNRPGLYALLLRVFARPEPLRMPNTAEYEGCISWVELERDLSTAGVQPVLEDAEWERLEDRVRERLGTEGVERL